MGGSADGRYNLSLIVQISVRMGSPIITVSLNYRLSGFGFPVGSESIGASATNIDSRDQGLALNRVDENIASFSGSLSMVTMDRLIMCEVASG